MSYDESEGYYDEGEGEGYYDEGEGEGEGYYDEGEGEGEGYDEGEGEGGYDEGEGEGYYDEGEGEGEAYDEGEGEGEAYDEGEGEGEGYDEGEGEGEGDYEGADESYLEGEGGEGYDEGADESYYDEGGEGFDEGGEGYAESSNPTDYYEVDQTNEIQCYGTALFDFEAMSGKELNFKFGDVLGLVNHEKGVEWWTAELNSKRGLVPYNYIDLGKDGLGGKTPQEAPKPNLSPEDEKKRLIQEKRRKIRAAMDERVQKLASLNEKRQSIEKEISKREEKQRSLKDTIQTLKQVTDSETFSYDLIKIILELQSDVDKQQKLSSSVQALLSEIDKLSEQLPNLKGVGGVLEDFSKSLQQSLNSTKDSVQNDIVEREKISKQRDELLTSLRKGYLLLDK